MVVVTLFQGQFRIDSLIPMDEVELQRQALKGKIDMKESTHVKKRLKHPTTGKSMDNNIVKI